MDRNDGGNFLAYRFPANISNSDISSVASSAALPIASSPANNSLVPSADSHELSAIDRDETQSEVPEPSPDQAARRNVRTKKHRLTKARAAALSISLHGQVVSAPFRR